MTPTFRPFALVLALALAAGTVLAAETKGFGADFSAKAVAADTGLPDYPGAVPQRDKGEDSGSVNLGLWGGSFGLRVVVAKYAVGDDLETVAQFYRRALARHGEVLDCSEPPPRPPKGADGKSRRERSKALTCDDGKPEPGRRLYKVGTPQLQRAVSLRPDPSGAPGTHFQLVMIENSNP